MASLWRPGRGNVEQGARCAGNSGNRTASRLGRGGAGRGWGAGLPRKLRPTRCAGMGIGGRARCNSARADAVARDAGRPGVGSPLLMGVSAWMGVRGKGWRIARVGFAD